MPASRRHAPNEAGPILPRRFSIRHLIAGGFGQGLSLNRNSIKTTFAGS